MAVSTGYKDRSGNREAAELRSMRTAVSLGRRSDSFIEKPQRSSRQLSLFYRIRGIPGHQNRNVAVVCFRYRASGMIQTQLCEYAVCFPNGVYISCCPFIMKLNRFQPAFNRRIRLSTRSQHRHPASERNQSFPFVSCRP
jgi:hypothetical protein